MAAARKAIFMGYRRDDTADVAGRIYDGLVKLFGRERIFKDVDSIPPGAQFRDYIKTTLSRCGVALILIGPHWLEAKDASGRRRLDNPEDLVRVEVETALAQPGLRVMPVLINGARMPAASSLPESLRPLCELNAAVVRRDPDFHIDLKRLGSVLDRGRLARRASIAAAATLVLGGLFVGWQISFPNAISDAAAAQAQLSRGWQVYREVCADCHSLRGVSYFMLGEEGGPLWDRRFTSRENPSVLGVARAATVRDVDANGARIERPATPADAIHAPYSNIAIAMLANNAVPPDLVAYSKSAPNPAGRVYAFLRGYRPTQTAPAASYYNAVVAGPDHLTRMAPTLQPGQVTYADGTTATSEQMARDVAAFAAWASGAAVEPPARLLASDNQASENFDDLFGNPELFQPLASRGERVAARCMACHTFDAGSDAGIGPNLHGVYGRRAATAPGFQYYSDALTATGAVWSGPELDAYLLSPRDAVPGTRMGFAGVQDDADRLALIAYLKSVSP